MPDVSCTQSRVQWRGKNLREMHVHIATAAARTWRPLRAQPPRLESKHQSAPGCISLVHRVDYACLPHFGRQVRYAQLQACHALS